MSKFPALEKAQGELNAMRKTLKDVFDEAGGMEVLDLSRVKSISGDSHAKITWIREQKKQIDEKATEVAGMKELSEMAAENAKEYFEKGSVEDPEEKRREGGRELTLGEAFVKSRAFKEKGQTAHIDNVDLKSDFTRSAGWPTESMRSGKVLLSIQRPVPTVTQYFPQMPVSQAAYKYMEETTFTNNAAETAEGGTYGEAALALTERSKTVEKIAVWIPVTDEQLEDVAGAEAYVNQRLTYMMQARLDAQLLVGNGTTPNLLGTENVSSIQTQAKGTDSTLDALYKLFTTIRESAFSEPSVVFIRPSKWQDVVLLKDANGNYIWNHPATDGAQTAWGVPVVLTTAGTSTKAITGDYRTHSMLGIRRGLDMQVTNSHASFFISGKQAIRADMRAVAVHFRPEAFGVVTGL